MKKMGKLFVFLAIIFIILIIVMFVLLKTNKITLKEVFNPPNVEYYEENYENTNQNGENDNNTKEPDRFDEYLEKEPIPFTPKLPKSWENATSYLDDVPNFNGMKVEERAKLYKERDNWSKEEKLIVKELENLIKTQEKAFNSGDYHTFLKNLHPGFRDDIGMSFSNFIDSRMFRDEYEKFVVDRIDGKYASGFYVKNMYYIQNNQVKQSKKEDGIIFFYKDKSDKWQIYFYWNFTDFKYPF